MPFIRIKLAAVPFRRGIKTLKHYRHVIDNYNPDKIVAHATSAIRSAENGNKFVKAVKEKTGIEVKVISGAKEAELIYYGVRQCTNLKGSPSLIMDIGGGSTEFIIADDKENILEEEF